MKVIIAGSRGVTSYRTVKDAVRASGFNITEVVSGTAKGVDMLGEKWAQKNKKKIKRFPAIWSLFGYAAGPIRNVQMADYADALVAVWDGKSPGTRNMIRVAEAAGIKVYVELTKDAHSGGYPFL